MDDRFVFERVRKSRNHIRISAVLLLLPLVSLFSQFLALSFFLPFFILLLLSVLSIFSTFSSFTFYVTNTTIFSLLLVIFLSCSLSFSLSSFICHFTRPFVPLFRAISVQRRQANEDLSDCGAVLPLFLLFLLALTSAN